MKLIKIVREGVISGERFWCQVLEEFPDGSRRVRVDSFTCLDGVPEYGEQLTLPASEEVLDEMELPDHTQH